MREARVQVRELSTVEVAQFAEQCYRESKQKQEVEAFRLMHYYGAQAKQNLTGRPFAHPYNWAAFSRWIVSPLLLARATQEERLDIKPPERTYLQAYMVIAHPVVAVE